LKLVALALFLLIGSTVFAAEPTNVVSVEPRSR
jgi:hypothetical protein